MPVTGLTGIGCLAAGEHVAIAVFARTQLAVAAARTLPGDGHRAVLAREGGDIERLRHRRIVDLALVEDLAGRVRGEFEQCANGYPAALIVERDDFVLGRAGVAGADRPQADGARHRQRFDSADQLAAGVLLDFTDVHGRSPGRTECWIECDRTPCPITHSPPPSLPAVRPSCGPCPQSFSGALHRGHSSACFRRADMQATRAIRAGRPQLADRCSAPGSR